MANYTTSDLKSGMRIIIDGSPCIVIENEFVKPGKGQAFYRVRIKDLKACKTINKTYRSGESIEAADILEIDMQYL